MGVVVIVFLIVVGVIGVVVGIIGVVVGVGIVVSVGVSVGVGAVVGVVIGGVVVVVVTSAFDCIFVLIKNGYRSPGSIKKSQSLIQNTDFWSDHTTKSLNRSKKSPTTY